MLIREYTMLVDIGFKNLFDALLKHQYAPTEETKAELDRLDAENKVFLEETQNKNEVEFVRQFGQKALEFIKSISDKYFLVGKSTFSLSWSIKSDENDDYWAIKFYKGKFNYVMDICGGYAGTKILEENISHERVLELINKP